MPYIRVIILSMSLILLSGCSVRNAFVDFDMLKDQEEAVENSHSTKILKGDKVAGIFSALYLNPIYPDMNQSIDTFYITTYLKDDSYEDLNITANSKKHINIAKLTSYNNYSHLLSARSQWSRYYLISFEANEDDSAIVLRVENGRIASGSVSFLKEL